MSAETTYHERLTARREALAEATARADRLGNVRLVLALVTVVLLLLPLFIRHGGPWWGLVPIAGAFVLLGVLQDKAFSRRRQAAAAVRFYEEGLMRLEEKWRELADDGADLAAPYDAETHYAGDLDLYGPASLFQLISRVSTAEGRRTLGRYLGEMADREEALSRQAAVTELAADLDLRERYVAAAAGEELGRIEDSDLLEWAEKGAPLANAKVLRVLGIVQPIALFATYLFYYFTANGWPLAVAIITQAATLVLTRKAVEQRAHVISGPERFLSRFARLIEAIESGQYQSPRMSELKSRLSADGVAASQQIVALEKIVNRLDARLNVFFALTFGPALLWDLNFVLRADQWRASAGPRLRGWFEAIGEAEALASFAALLYERPDYTMPELVEVASTFEAEQIAHPLLDRRAVVANDLTLKGAGSVLLLSGSNMSGKSTLLRSVGINLVLARAGAPVAAKSLRVSMFSLATSVRIVDSLASGTSHFYAELKRLKYVVDEAAAHREDCLYLLDEMLHGTNSRERFIGATSVIRWLSKSGATGIVTTHDLSLAKVAEDLPPGLATNAHFSDDVNQRQIQFDYRLRTGPVVSTNALRLMKAVGIDVELTEDAAT
ncbi:MAG: hypothetical protein RIT81_09015 [Deltaproteobacteria bacterium]